MTFIIRYNYGLFNRHWRCVLIKCLRKKMEGIEMLIKKLGELLKMYSHPRASLMKYLRYFPVISFYVLAFAVAKAGEAPSKEQQTNKDIL